MWILEKQINYRSSLYYATSFLKTLGTQPGYLISVVDFKIAYDSID